MVRWSWVNFQCRGVLLIWIIVRQGSTALVVGAGGGCLDVFSLVYHFSFLSPSLWETARYRLKYCLKGPLNPKQLSNQQFSKIVLASKTDPQFSAKKECNIKTWPILSRAKVTSIVPSIL